MNIAFRLRAILDEAQWTASPIDECEVYRNKIKKLIRELEGDKSETSDN
ncbi:MAG: hypothetical protein K9K32_06745 [Halanaerobiales bacterium]|nr:hypothetical protein [Halanaerobiales bacterium]